MHEEVIRRFREAADPEKAEGMKAYMKHQFEFLGIQKAQRVKLSREFMKRMKAEPTIDWGFVDICWALPEREFQYLAMEYLVMKKVLLTAEDLPSIKTLIVTKSWWDTVDLLASQLLGQICQAAPELKQEAMIPWSQDENLWIRRSAILFQLKYKEELDPALLSQIIGYNQECREFFIAKAIGWILREYSKTNPDWVRTFIQGTALQPLSVREGSKYMG